jgi:protein TonB
MLLIVSAHVALIALVMSAKMEFQAKPPLQPPLINVPIDPPPPANRAAEPKPSPTPPANYTQPDVSLPHPDEVRLDPGPAVDPGVTVGGGGASTVPQFLTQVAPIRHEARLLTPLDELKPPYPELKILSGEEASLRLQLTISESGRVTAVEPVGAADRVFLEAARRYLIAHWRYSPATEDGRPITSSIVISLRFQLDG